MIESELLDPVKKIEREGGLSDLNVMKNTHQKKEVVSYLNG